MNQYPKTIAEARQLIESGQLRQMLKIRLVLMAFDATSQTSLKALLELLAMPEQEIDDWTTGLTAQELQQALDYIEKLENDLFAAAKRQNPNGRPISTAPKT